MRDFIQKLTPQFLLNLYYQFWPFLGAVIYGFSSRKIKVIGVTGTTGKTTVVHMISDILENAGYRVASISSLRFKIGDREWKNMLKMTMPGRMKVQKFLRDAVNSDCQYAVLEVTSEGIKQARHKFIDFELAVFTNLKPEHIERHGGFLNYKKAKGELFKIAKAAVINFDDEYAEYFSNLCGGKKYGYSLKSNNFNLKLFLPGEFNLSNALAAASACLAQGLDTGVIKRTLENFKGVPGRMEVVVKEPFTVIVDYAHTPDALEKVYQTIKEAYKLKVPTPTSVHGRDSDRSVGAKSYQLVCVLGAAGGGRDKWKRPEMGRIAAQHCDQIILTDEDPYDEKPEEIIDDIEAGITSYQLPVTSYERVIDRREAIEKALQIARPNDVVIITGKGAEPMMMTKDGPVPWDDREIVREEFARLNLR